MLAVVTCDLMVTGDIAGGKRWWWRRGLECREQAKQCDSQQHQLQQHPRAAFQHHHRSPHVPLLLAFHARPRSRHPCTGTSPARGRHVAVFDSIQARSHAPEATGSKASPSPVPLTALFGSSALDPENIRQPQSTAPSLISYKQTTNP